MIVVGCLDMRWSLEMGGTYQQDVSKDDRVIAFGSGDNARDCSNSNRILQMDKRVWINIGQNQYFLFSQVLKVLTF